MSISGVLLLALRSLKWKSLPSKKSQGQHMGTGMGAPQTSLAARAVSTPDMKREASWTPRGMMLGSCCRKSKENVDSFRHSSHRV